MTGSPSQRRGFFVDHDDLCAMSRRLIMAGAALMAFAVLLGAFGAHGLKARLGPEALGQWRTGVEYQFYHALGLLLAGAMGGRIPAPRGRVVAWLFSGGIALFSGSLYLLSAKDLIGLSAIGAVAGPLTPIGGLLFVAGWCVLFITALRQHDAR